MLPKRGHHSQPAPPAGAGRDRSSSTPSRGPLAPCSAYRATTAANPHLPETFDEWQHFHTSYKRGGSWTQAPLSSSSRRPVQPPDMLRRPGNRRSLTVNDAQSTATGGQRPTFSGPGEMLDPMRFFLTAGYLPAPLPTRKALQARRAALRQYGFTKPTYRHELLRYAKHARKVFKVAAAQFMTPCAEDDSIVMCVTEDLAQPREHSILHDRSTSVCAHAMLNNDPEVVVIPDLEKDWRFKSNPTVIANKAHFYASAPMLVDSLDPNDKTKICIGQLSISDGKPRYDFGEEEAEMLGDIAQMACESLQQEIHRIEAARATRVQSSITTIADYSWNNSSYQSSVATDSTTEVHCDLAALIVKTIAECLEGSATIIDTTAYRLSTARTASVVSGSRSVLSPSSAGSGSAGNPSASPQRRQRTRDFSSGWSSHSTSLSADETFVSPPSSSHATTPDDAPYEFSSSSGGDGGGPSTSSSSSSSSFGGGGGGSGRISHSRSSSRNLFGKGGTASGTSWEDGQYIAQIDPAHKPTIFASDGDPRPVHVSDARGRAAMGRLLAEWRRERDFHGPVRGGQSMRGPYLTQASGPSSMSSPSEDDFAVGEESASPISPKAHSMMDPLGCLWDPANKPAMYVANPITADAEDPQATFLIIVAWNDVKILQKTDYNLLTAATRILEASLLRQRARLADRTQLDFVRSIQHEMRTPLNGISGVTELLRASVAAGGRDLDMSPDGFLSGCLEGIRLAAGNVSSILDDVLDFGDLSGIRSASAAAARLDEAFLASLIEDVGQEEVEVAAITLRHSAELAPASQRENLDVRPPDFFVSIDPSLRGRFRVDRPSMRKIFRKLLHNAFRFTTREPGVGGFVEVKIRPAERDKNDVEEGDEGGAGGDGSATESAMTSSMFDDGGASKEVWVAFEFIDSGCGMDATFLRNKYLQPFAKADPFKQGTGLGGAIAAGLTQRLGGHMDVNSEPGKGTQVTIVLSLVALADTTGAGSASASGSGCSCSCKSKGPLAVSSAHFFGFDDTPGGDRIEEMLRAFLQDHGVSCRSDAPQEADVIVSLSSFLSKRYPAGCDERLPFTAKEGARFVVVSSDPLQRSAKLACMEQMMRGGVGAVHLFQPPFGPASLATLLEFLQDPKPFVLREPPAHYHHSNQQEQGEEKNDAQPPPLSPAAMRDAQKTTPEDADEEVVTPTPNSAVQAVKEAGREEEAALTQAESKADSEGKASGGKEEDLDDEFRVLAVEDNPTNMKILTVVLQRLGINYAEAHDGGEAITKYKAYRPHLVLLDISLPVADGFQVCKEMRAHEHDAADSAAETADGAIDAVVDVGSSVVASNKQRFAVGGGGAGNESTESEQTGDASSLAPSTAPTTLSWTYRRPRIAAVTALSSKEDQRKGLELGMDEWHTKPLAPRALTTLLKAWKQEWEEEKEERRSRTASEGSGGTGGTAVTAGTGG
ncbi:hypothetical protein BDZ90DRAFT_232393 [Jaminaea rosea]|uniref:histidine kinase n=1 Tax=Jaminaea rosea TaxID=1569628 RepID=A0A316UQ43_9BASI|nr:hypothetical protein BDZ90DRAFT_232393 [Jaminaea rosea]PWN27419.1 hypothetical protein BDZ90DRAFT_232393 [Jaminaea rosea]